MAQTRDEKGKLILAREPIWSRQVGESEKNHQAFMAYVNADGEAKMGEVCEQAGIGLSVMTLDKWRDRADHFWADVDQQVNDAMQRRLMKLRERAVEGALMLAEVHETVEASKRTRKNPKSGKVLYEDETITKRKHAPNSFVVNKVLDNIMGSDADTTSDSETLSKVFEAMVSRSFESHDSPSDEGPDNEQGAV